MAERTAPPDAFGRAAREYELGRPEWPELLLDRLVAAVGIGADATVLDLGAGTGKLTRALTQRFARVVAVEPDQAMRRILAQVVPAAEALAGRGDAIPLAEDSVDCVFAAEAFHWFSTRGSVDEIARVLRPAGSLVLLWNLPVGDVQPPLGEEADRLLAEAFARGGAPGLPKVLSGEWRQAFVGSRFEQLREDELEREVESDRERLIANILSISSIASLPKDARTKVARRLQELVPPGRYRRTLRTIAYWTRLGD